MAENKNQSFLTAKEKWLIGIFIATAVTATITFVVNLVLILQLKDSINTGETAAFRKDFQNRTANLENQMLQNEKETETLHQEFQNNVTQMLQNQNEAEYLRQASQHRITRLENRLGEVEKSKTRYDKLLAKEGWMKLSNGLHYQVFVWKDDAEVAFGNAENYCNARGARLASTGIRNVTIRREISSSFPGINKLNTWIGLNQPYRNTTWVWSDGKLYENADMRWGNTYCPDTTASYGRIHWGSLYCYWTNVIVKHWICEI